MSKVDVLCLGELMIDMKARYDDKGDIDGFSMKAGGAAGNVAVAVSRLGGNAGVIAKVSGDVFGEHLKKSMLDNGVNTDGMIMDPERKIAIAYLTYDAEQRPNYLFYRENSASASFTSDELDRNIFEGAKVLYFSSLGLAREPMRSTNFEAARIAGELGVRVAFDPNLRFSAWTDQNEIEREVKRMMTFTHILKMNDEELAYLFGEGDIEEKCLEILNDYPSIQTISITLGAKGAFIMVRSGIKASVPAIDNDVVDTIGAGDAFFAMLAIKSIEYEFNIDTEDKLCDTLKYCNTAALLTAKRPGAIPAMPLLSEVEEYKKQYDK